MGLKEEDRVSISLIRGNYKVKWIGDRMVVLESEDNSNELLTTVDYLKSFSPLRNPKVKKKMDLQLRN